MPPRTKACAVCRKKRIKCDATLPQCLMCIRTGQLCPGPLTGPLIMDMTAKAKYGMQRRKKPDVVSKGWEDGMQVHHFATRVSQRAVIIEAFYGRFLEYFTSDGEGNDIQNQTTWLQRLPYLAMDGSGNALVLALEATATAFSAITSANTALTRHAWNLYGEALRAHQSLLQRPRSKSEVTVHMVSTSVLFSFFEAMQATTADAYRSHVYGAAKMLEVTGPGQCTQGVLCQLLYHVRTQMLFVQLASAKTSIPVSAKKILYDTLLYVDLPIIQRLMCYTAALGELQTQLCGTEELGAEAYRILRLQIDRLWDEYIKNTDTSSSARTCYGILTVNMRFSDTFTALIVAYFSSAYILLAAIAPLKTDSSSSVDHSQVILNVALHLDTAWNGVAYMRMATPLLMVAVHARSRGQRAQAIEIFKLWTSGSMRGISALALDAIYHKEKARQARKKIPCFRDHELAADSESTSTSTVKAGSTPTPLSR